MKFDFAHVFRGIALERYEKLFFDDAFNEEMKPVAGLKYRGVLEHKDEGTKLTRKLLVAPVRDFPGPIKRLIDTELTYTEDSVFDRTTHVLTWRSKTSVLPDKIDLHGTIAFSAVASGIERRISGEVKVSVFGLGGMIEKMIVDNLRETYDKIAVFTQKWIDDGRAV